LVTPADGLFEVRRYPGSRGPRKPASESGASRRIDFGGFPRFQRSRAGGL